MSIIKNENRERHRWEEVEGLLEKCKFCGSFRSKSAFAHMGTLKRKGNGESWIFKYSKKGSSKWLDNSPDCI
jgi:hypothetical protein